METVAETLPMARLYVAEDDAANRLLLERILGRAGYADVHAFADGETLLAAVAAVEPDLILLDLHLPGADGLEVLAAISAQVGADGYLPVLVLTGDLDRTVRDRALASGAADFLTKPFDAGEVVLRVRNLLHSRTLHEMLRAQNRTLMGDVALRTQALEQTADSIVVIDPDGTVTYVNHAFTRLYGYEPAAVLGQNARILDSGQRDASSWSAFHEQIASGRNWSGSLVNRRSDGTPVEVESVVSAIRDADGRITHYVQADRDVSRERSLERALARRAHERAAIEGALAHLDPGAAPEAIAATACAAMVELPTVHSVWVTVFAGDHAQVLGIAGQLAGAFPPGRLIPIERARYLRERAAAGPWTDDWRRHPVGGTYGEVVAATGLRLGATAPLRGPQGLLGIVGFGSHDSVSPDELIEHLPGLTTFASILGTLLAPGLAARQDAAAARADVQALLDQGAFAPFFQPIVELHTGAVVGHEALTRFTDGRRPDHVFTAAAQVGLGTALEVATLTAALAGATVLPEGTYLSLNVSPDLVGSPELTVVLSRCERPIVLEITEHVAIDDYGLLRARLQLLGSDIRLAVDDAGAGYASLRHVVELEPDLVKLDLGLVRGIDADPARQALIAGMCYFGAKRHISLVAEGIETEAEFTTLRSLGVQYGQGYLLGRPRDGRASGPWPTQFALLTEIVPRARRQGLHHPSPPATGVPSAARAGAG